MNATMQDKPSKTTEPGDSLDRLVSHRRTIELGAMCPKLSTQLAGLKLSQGLLDLLDKLADSLTWCHLHGLVTDAEHDRAGHRLIARVRKEVRKVANTELTDRRGAGSVK